MMSRLLFGLTGMSLGTTTLSSTRKHRCANEQIAVLDAKDHQWAEIKVIFPEKPSWTFPTALWVRIIIAPLLQSESAFHSASSSVS
jgi:hypothetical protein